MKSERGAPVRGSDPPSGHSVHNTAGDTWRVPARRLIQTHFLFLGADDVKRGKISDPSPMAKKTFFFFSRFGRSAQDAAGNFSPPRPRIDPPVTSWRLSSTFFIGFARDEAGWPWVDSMSRSKVYRRVSLFFIGVLTIRNAKH